MPLHGLQWQMRIMIRLHLFVQYWNYKRQALATATALLQSLALATASVLVLWYYLRLPCLQLYIRTAAAEVARTAAAAATAT